jgi:hypothetical protein
MFEYSLYYGGNIELADPFIQPEFNVGGYSHQYVFADGIKGVLIDYE